MVYDGPTVKLCDMLAIVYWKFFKNRFLKVSVNRFNACKAERFFLVLAVAQSLSRVWLRVKADLFYSGLKNANKNLVGGTEL